MWAKNKHSPGFTIVELLIVVVVIAILAAITVVAFNGIQDQAVRSTLQSDLRNASTLFELEKVKSGTYPTTMPAEIKTSNEVVLQATNTGSSNTYCINAYHQSKPLRMSWNSGGGGLQDNLCNGVTIGSARGGAVPTTPRGINVAQDFSRWTLSGGATYDSSTKELSLGATGSVTSPLTRVDAARTMEIGGDLYASATAPSGCVSGGCYHTDTYYYASDGTTLVTNSDNYTGNGCAQPITRSAWQSAVKSCAYNGGPNVVYLKFRFLGSNNGYANPDLKIKNPLLILAN